MGLAQQNFEQAILLNKERKTTEGVAEAQNALAEVFLELNQPALAFPEFEAVLRSSPRRFNATYGAARGGAVVFGVILGTGVGAGIVMDRKVFSGQTGIAGEWGHNPLPWPDPSEYPGHPCYCGRQGCMERYVSGTAFAAEYASRTGYTLKGHEIVAAMRSGDAEAQATYQHYVRSLARGLAVIANVLDPNAFVLGGGMSNVDELYRDLPELMRPHVLSSELETPILKPLHGDSAGVRGAAWLWDDSDDLDAQAPT